MLVVAAVAALAPAVASADPVVSTKPATDLTADGATLNATVDPLGAPVTVHFEIGTDEQYGLESARQDVPAGNGPVTVAISVRGLTTATTYHVRAVATAGATTVRGSDVGFTTMRDPTDPLADDVAAQDVTLTSATLTGTVTPRGAATTYRFEYGHSRSYGTSTPPVSAGDGWSPVPVSVPITGLQQGKTYHYRLVATNANGTYHTSDHRFVVSSTPSAASLAASQYLVPYGAAAKLRGRLGGPRKAGVTVRLQATMFPFDTPFTDVATTTTDAKGRYHFTLPDLMTTTRAVVIAEGTPDVLSPAITVRVAVETGLAHLRATARRVIATGSVRPAIPGATVSLQRSTPSGKWLTVRRRAVNDDGSYRISVRRWTRGGDVRVVGVAHDQGGHASAPSRTVSVAPMPRKPRRHHG